MSIPVTRFEANDLRRAFDAASDMRKSLLLADYDRGLLQSQRPRKRVDTGGEDIVGNAQRTMVDRQRNAWRKGRADSGDWQGSGAGPAYSTIGPGGEARVDVPRKDRPVQREPSSNLSPGSGQPDAAAVSAAANKRIAELTDEVTAAQAAMVDRAMNAWRTSAPADRSAAARSGTDPQDPGAQSDVVADAQRKMVERAQDAWRTPRPKKVE